MTDKELIARSLRESHILICDDDTEITSIYEHHLVSNGYSNVKISSSGTEALQMIDTQENSGNPFDLVVLDLCFQGDTSGQNVYEDIARNRNLPVIIVSALNSRDDMRDALHSGIVEEYLIKPVDLEILRLVIERALSNRLFVQHLQSSRRRNQKMFLNILQVMAKVLEAKDSNTRSHSENVAKYARQLAKRLGYGEDEMEAIQIAGILHDFGKIGVDEALLRKPGKLSDSEYQHIKQHPLIASIILEPLDELKNIIQDIRHHHERYDGSGYPDGLTGCDIPLGARILSIADSYDAMTSRRSYHEPLKAEVAIAELKRCAGSQFDPELVEIFDDIIMGPRQGVTMDI